TRRRPLRSRGRPQPMPRGAPASGPRRRRSDAAGARLHRSYVATYRTTIYYVPDSGVESDLADSDYRSLLAFRTGIRRFLNWRETQAAKVGVSPAQHQLMLAIRGHDGPDGPTIRDVADALILRHNSAVGLVDRAVEAGLVARHVDEHDARVVRLR